MCFHNSLTVDVTALEHRYNARRVEHFDFSPIYHAAAFTNPFWPVLTNEVPQSLQLFQWGLIPSFVKNEEQAHKIRTATYNARLETLEQKPSFRGLLSTRRCIIPSTGFFEWQHVNGQKVPWYIFIPEHKIFSIAGIWSSWTHPTTGRSIFTFSIITVPAIGIVKQIHNTKQRMPFVLHPEVEKKWVSSYFHSDDIQICLDLLSNVPFEAYPVSKKISFKHVDTNTPDILTPFHYSFLFFEVSLFCLL